MKRLCLELEIATHLHGPCMECFVAAQCCRARQLWVSYRVGAIYRAPFTYPLLSPVPHAGAFDLFLICVPDVSLACS